MRPRVRDLALLAVLICVTAGNVRLRAEAIDPPTFVAQLDRLVSVIALTSANDLTALRDTIPAEWVVRVEDEEIRVPAAWLRRDFEEGRRDAGHWPTRRSDIIARLSSMRDEAAALRTHEGSVGTGAARNVLTAVLAEKEFRRNANAGAMARIRRAIGDWIVRVWQQLGGERLGRRMTAVVVAWIAGLAALITLAWWIVRTLVRTSDHRRLSLEAPPVVRRSSRAWALDAASARDPREAARYAYRAAVARLEEEGTWRPDETRTPREHVRLLPHAHGRRGVFADVAQRFEEIWFGGRLPTRDDTRETLARLRELGCLPAD